MLTKLLHPEKALLPIDVTCSGMTISVRFLQEINAAWPMLVRLSGSVTCVIFHPIANDILPTVVTPSSITTFVNWFL